MRLHLSPTSIARVLRNLGYVPGRDVEFPYTVHLDPTDYPVGTTIDAGKLVIAQEFGSQALGTWQITKVSSAAGQITDDGGSDGIAALHFLIDAAAITVFRSLGPIVFEVTLTDSRGLQATLDSGSLVPAPSTATEPVASVTVAPNAAALDVGQTQQLTVTAYDINGNVLPGRTVTYASSASSNATVSPTGLVTGVASGAALITATCEGKSATCNITVVAVDHVTIAPAPLSIAKFLTQQFTGQAFDASNNPLNNRVFTWASSDPTIATIDAVTGLLTAVLGGSVTITGTSETKSATSAVTVTVAVNQMTPPELITAFNALGGTTVGATFRGLFLYGIQQTILPNGDAGLPSPGTNSPTGYWLTKWDDAVHPNQGKHLRPSADVNGGNGCPAVPFNTGNLALGGRTAGQGIEWPASVGYSMGAAETVPRTFIANSGSGVSNVLTDHGAGFTIGAFGNMHNGGYVIYLGETGNADKSYFSSDYGFGREALVDSASGFLDGLVSTTPTKQHMAMWCASINGLFGATWSQDFMYMGRDLVWNETSINVNDGTFFPTPSSNTSAVRRVRFTKDGANAMDRYSGLDCIYALTGRANLAQKKLLHDWAEFQSWGAGLWNDTRNRLTYYFGDSLYTSSIQNISRGSNGAAAIPSHAIVNLAQAGDYPEKHLYHLVEIFRDLDFSKRLATAGVCFCGPGEYVNDIVNDSSPTNCITRNYFWADALRALNSQRVRIVMGGQTYANAGTLTNGQTMRTSLQATALAHADVYFDQIDTLPFSAWHFQDGQLANQKPTFFDGTSHWNAFANEYFDAMYRNCIVAAYGLDDSARPYKIDPDVTNVSLTAGSPTTTRVWTVKNRPLTTLVGRTITYSSLDTGIATVNSSTGLITRVAAGTARIKAVTDLGAVGEIDVVCT